MLFTLWFANTITVCFFKFTASSPSPDVQNTEAYLKQVLIYNEFIHFCGVLFFFLLLHSWLQHILKNPARLFNLYLQS